MKLMPLHKIAAPSSSVLSFLRNQIQHTFESPTSRCAAFKEPRRGIATINRRSGHRDAKIRNDGFAAASSIGAQCRGLTPARRCHLTTRGARPGALLAVNTSSTPLNITSSRRDLSTSSFRNAWELFGGKKRQPAQLRPPPPPLADVGGDTSNGNGLDVLGRITQPANNLKMRCTELDEHGNVTMVSGEFKKSELIAKYGLLPRDLRKIDSSLLPNILIRPTAILINLLHIRALIKHNRVLVFDAYGTTDSKSQSAFMYDLDVKLRQKESLVSGTLPYELRALEAVLISVTLGLEKEFEGVSEPVVRVLKELEEDIDRDKLRYMLVYSKKLGTFEQKARLVRDALDELLEADDDLSAMYLSEKAEGKVREDDDHTEVEMLLESYHKVADEIVNSAENLVSSIRNTEEIVKAILDANRNALMLLDLKFSIFTLALTAGTFVAALYGMNLKNFFEESDVSFGAVSGFCAVFGFWVAVYGFKKLRKVQRRSMWGHGGSIRGASQGWGLGIWRSKLDSEAKGVPRLRAGESLSEMVQRERAMSMARRMAGRNARAQSQAGAAADEVKHGA